jgi:outer membrane protein assembly factor BamB/tetratricopeptide (TPR) repeat protein
MYPHEDLLVQDGLVFTTISKAGPSLIALDEVTGQIKWAYGPMVASSEEEARMRFEAAPAGGPRTIYAGYVQDNIEGDTHTDSEYGVIAFDSTTGRVQWRTQVCRMAPGKFSAGFAEKRRNRIRSFISPPLYHEGTVYYCTNAGAIAAIDAQSGRVKWLSRYPYFLAPEIVHDATRVFGALPEWSGLVNSGGMHEPSFWFDQRPLLVGERLYMLPVDSPLMLCVDRRTGKIAWTRSKGDTGYSYVLGPTREGHLVIAGSGRRGIVSLVDPASGETVWVAPDPMLPESQPVVKYHVGLHPFAPCGMADPREYDGLSLYLVARPFLTNDDRLYTTYYPDYGHGAMGATWCVSLAELSLPSRKITAKRRFYTASALAFAQTCIDNAKAAKAEIAQFLPPSTDEERTRNRKINEVCEDTVPVNKYGPFSPFSRITFYRYGQLFELRMTAREVGMLYDRSAVQKAIATRTDPSADFARAELAIADSRFDEAATLLKKCLETISSEDLDFRAAINQQLYRVHQRLARTAIRTAKIDDELANGLGMSRTCSTLAEEIETLFALSEAYERTGDLAGAARCLRTIIETYGKHEYPVSPLAVLESKDVLGAATGVLDRTSGFVGSNLYGKELSESLSLMKKGLPLYLSTVSPLPKTLTLRAGERAAAQLARLQKSSPEFAKQFETTADKELAGKDETEQLQRIWEFPGTAAAQKTLDALCESGKKLDAVAWRRRLWQLADAARVCGLKMPPGLLVVPNEDGVTDRLNVTIPQDSRSFDFQDAEGSARLVLARQDDLSRHGELLFIGGRVRKRVDNKFLLSCMDLKSGERKWEISNIRLKGSGQEPGFYEAFVVGDAVVVHGLYDVLCYAVKDGALLWQYRVPFDFEIKHAMLSGDLLILSGKTETQALYIPTSNPNGEVAWQVGEMGDLYAMPYTRGDRLISVRKLPFSVTIRYRTTGRLIGRLDLPDLSMFAEHPLIEGGPEDLPIAHAGNLLAVTDGWYYIMIDTDKLSIAWKRLIDNNDMTREPPMRLYLSPNYLCVLKDDYDRDGMYMLSTKTGDVLWSFDPKDSKTPSPMHSVLIDGETAYGIVPHAGQGFYLAAIDCKTGRRVYREEFKTAATKELYQSKPKVTLLDRLHGKFLVAEIEDRQDVEVKVFELSTGKLACEVGAKGDGPLHVHGNASSTIQGGRTVLLSKAKLQY